MLADPNKYRDTLWLPNTWPYNAIEFVPSRSGFLSCIPVKTPANSLAGARCPHPSVMETYVGRNPAACAVSVVLMAMLFSTAEFNVLQILRDSGKFDLREPLLFHQCRPNWDNKMEWSLVAVNPLGMALLLDTFK